MRCNGWQGVRRQKTVRTTIADPTAQPPDLVDRQFGVPAPNRLLVADFTYVKLSTGVFVYVAFVIDAYAGTIVGWEASGSKRTRFVESAIRQAAALRSRQGHPIDGATTIRMPVRRPVHVGSVHPTAHRRRCRPLGPISRRCTRQRLGRDHRRVVQERTHPPARPMARRRPRRTLHRRMGPLVQHRTPAPVPRRLHPRGRRQTPLRSQTHPTKSRVTQHNQSPDSPGRPSSAGTPSLRRTQQYFHLPSRAVTSPTIRAEAICVGQRTSSTATKSGKF